MGFGVLEPYSIPKGEVINPSRESQVCLRDEGFEMSRKSMPPGRAEFLINRRLRALLEVGPSVPACGVSDRRSEPPMMLMMLASRLRYGPR